MSDHTREIDKDATTDEGIWKEAAERLRISTDSDGDNRVHGLECINFSELGKQWDDDIKNERTIDGRPALTINQTKTKVRRVQNTLRQQRPRIKVHPTGGGARVEDAQVINGLIRHIETMSTASVAYDNGGAGATNNGWGYWRILGDYVAPDSFDQELLIKPVMNQFTVYDDPGALMPAGEDRMWIVLTEVMKRTEYKRRYPQETNVDYTAGDAPGDMSLDWENRESIRLAEYYRIHEVRDTLVLMNDGRSVYKSQLPSEETMAIAGWMPAMKDGKPITRPTSRRQVQWFRLNGKKVIEKRDLPGRYIPVIRCLGNQVVVNGQVVRTGMVTDLMDPARMYNYWRTMETERYALAPKAPWVMAEGQDDGHPEWDDANQKSYSRLVYKPVTDGAGNALPPPQRQMPVQIEAGMSQAAQGALQDFEIVAGMPMENPSEQGRVVSGNKYLARRQGLADLVHYQYYDNQTLAIMWTGIILLDLIPYYYDMKRMQRIIGEDGTPEMVEINPGPDAGEDESGVSRAIYNVKHNLEVGRYDVVMDAGPGYQTKREESTESVLGLLGTPLAEPIVKSGADVVLRAMDFWGADELADRLAPSTPQGMEKVMKGLPKQAQTIITSMQGQIQQMTQLIQQQALEIKYKGQIEAAKMEGDLKKADMQDASKRYDTEIKAGTARDVAEIHAAAQLLNSQMESASEERAADRMIEKGLEA